MLGDSVTLFLKGNVNQPQPGIGAELIGFDGDLMVLRKQGRLRVLRTSVFETMQDRHGHVIDQRTLGLLMDSGELPSMTALVVQTDDGQERLPKETVQRVETPAGKSARWICAGIGLVVDAFVVWYFYHEVKLF